jgi:hypothetical protein
MNLCGVTHFEGGTSDTLEGCLVIYLVDIYSMGFVLLCLQYLLGFVLFFFGIL